MFFLFTNIAAIILYATASVYGAVGLRKKVLDSEGFRGAMEYDIATGPFSVIHPTLLKLIMISVVIHGMGLYGVIVSSEGLALGFFKVSSLIVWCINLIVLISGLRKPLQNLWLFLLPMSVVTVAISLMSQSPLWQHISPGIGAHIILSILAYSLFTIAFLQAVLLMLQNHQLKRCKVKGFVLLMPPLETMERLLFEFVWVGQILLTLGIGVGMIYIDDIFVQHLAHKTVLSMLAWLIFAALLSGRYRMGWRGNMAVRWIISGFCLLMLAFFGSKLVLEIILQR